MQGFHVVKTLGSGSFGTALLVRVYDLIYTLGPPPHWTAGGAAADAPLTPL